jgi:hypothetical protein
MLMALELFRLLQVRVQASSITLFLQDLCKLLAGRQLPLPEENPTCWAEPAQALVR